MKIEFIYFVTLWLNVFLVKSGVSETFSLREILLRWRMDAKNHCRVLPGSYCEVHDDPNPTNTNVSRTHKGIALGPTGNLQGSVKFYCLNTGRVLKRRAFTNIPMPTAFISKVDNIGKKESQGKEFRFLNRNREPFDWTDEIHDDDEEFQGLLGEEAPFSDISSELPGVILEDELVDPTTALEEEPETAFGAKSVAALYNANIQADKQICAAQTQVATVPIVEAQPDEIMYEVELGADEPDKGLHAPPTPPSIPDVDGCGTVR